MYVDCALWHLYYSQTLNYHLTKAVRFPSFLESMKCLITASCSVINYPSLMYHSCLSSDTHCLQDKRYITALVWYENAHERAAIAFAASTSLDCSDGQGECSQSCHRDLCSHCVVSLLLNMCGWWLRMIWLPWFLQDVRNLCLHLEGEGSQHGRRDTAHDLNFWYWPTIDFLRLCTPFSIKIYWINNMHNTFWLWIVSAPTPIYLTWNWYCALTYILKCRMHLPLHVRFVCSTIFGQCLLQGLSLSIV